MRPNHATTSLFYRKDLLKAAGIDPASIKTGDQLAEAAKKLTQDTDKDGRIDVYGFGTPLSSERTGGTIAFSVMLVGERQTRGLRAARPTVPTTSGCARCSGTST